MKCLCLNKSYNITPKTFKTLTQDNYIFVKYFDKLHKAITTDNIINIYPLIDYSMDILNDYIKSLLINNFSLNNNINIQSIDNKIDIKNKDDKVFKFINKINDIRVINSISKLILYYKFVYIVNFVYDNPINDIFYVICKNKINDDNIVINIYDNDYVTNINENKEDIYIFLYMCYYYWFNLLNNQQALTNHFKLLKLINNVS